MILAICSINIIIRCELCNFAMLQTETFFNSLSCGTVCQFEVCQFGDNYTLFRPNKRFCRFRTENTFLQRTPAAGKGFVKIPVPKTHLTSRTLRHISFDVFPIPGLGAWSTRRNQLLDFRLRTDSRLPTKRLCPWGRRWGHAGGLGLAAKRWDLFLLPRKWCSIVQP